MKIKNKSIKPIFIGGLNLLPGKTATATEKYKKVVDFYISRGFLEIVKEPAKSSKVGSSKDESAKVDQDKSKPGEA